MTDAYDLGDNYRRISFWIHGWWGAGKTWLGQSLPGTKLILDTEGGAWDTPSDKVLWSPTTEPVPVVDKGTSVVADITEWPQFQKAVEILETGNHPFDSVIADSVSSMQEQLKMSVQDRKDPNAYNPNAVFADHAWGRLLENMRYLFRRMMVLRRPSSPRQINVALISGSNTEAVPIAPLLEGGIRTKVPGMVNIMGYLTAEPDEKGEELRVMQIVSTKMVVAKCNEHRVKEHYGPMIVSPNLTEIIAVANGFPL